MASGLKGLLAPWIGGAASTHVTNGGYRGLLAFWAGGAAGITDSALHPPLLTNTQTFYSPTVTTGAVTLHPSLYTNTQTFYSATVRATYTLRPALFTNTQTFYSPTVSQTGAALFPNLYTNTQAFFTATITGGTHPDTAVTGGGYYRGRTRPIEDERRSALRKAYVVIRKNAKKLSRELRDEILDVILFEGPNLPPVGKLDLDATVRDVDLKRAEEVFARAIVDAELPEPELEPISEYAPLAELKLTNHTFRLPDAPDGTWMVGMSAAIAIARQRYEQLLQDEEELLLLLS